MLEDNVPLKRAAGGIHVARVENLHIARKHRTPCTLTTMLDTRSTYFFVGESAVGQIPKEPPALCRCGGSTPFTLPFP